MAVTAEVATTIPAGTWKVDPVHSSIEFVVRNMGILDVPGHFAEFEGTLESDGTLEGTRAYGTVKAASVDTRSEQRDAHLRGPEFFAVDAHPDLSFRSRRIEPAEDGKLLVTGDLTIKGVTREVAFDAFVQGTVPDAWGNERVGVQAAGEINRRDFGLEWDQRGPTGAQMASDRVRITLRLGAIKQPPPSTG